jgi:hypothetical protein
MAATFASSFLGSSAVVAVPELLQANKVAAKTNNKDRFILCVLVDEVKGAGEGFWKKWTQLTGNDVMNVQNYSGIEGIPGKLALNLVYGQG